MKIRREDLVAAAGAGLLQYRQIEPLLVFLLQHDLLQSREAMLAMHQPRQGLTPWLIYIAAILAFVTATLFGVVVVAGHVPGLAGPVALGAFCYLVATASVVTWKRRYGHAMSLQTVALLAMATLPLILALFGAYRFAS
ncbi:hypothetical protein [Noviherbaspirillum galbum]|uniref:Uncharacterized protein n=1 Tax=Noviherbaspirillum galbum TaxID=2709383 RepID=A0A6B3SIJ5_9BURK|nr:hypothetical protein [Noviherbaspirillum galbum]NEX60513.1 hypothetical protein [Noviherbaspirillum galbum]